MNATEVIQIRGIPDDVHAKLVDVADRAGKSLTAYLADELELIVGRADLVWHNPDVIIAGPVLAAAPAGIVPTAMPHGSRRAR